MMDAGMDSTILDPLDKKIMTTKLGTNEKFKGERNQ